MRRKSTPKKATIISKARKVFSDLGYTKTTMKDIGRACKCEASNIYNYFPSKEALLNEILLDEMTNLLTPLRYLKTDTKNDPAEQLRIMIRHHLNTVLGTRGTHKQIFEGEFKHLRVHDRKIIIALRDEWQEIMESVLQRGIDKGIFKPLDVKMTGFFILSIVIRTRAWYKPSGRLSIEQIANEIIKMTMHGIMK